MKIIDVVVIVFPNGMTYWSNKTDAESIKEIIGKWSKHHAFHIDSGLTFGCVTIKMIEDEYWTMTAIRSEL